MGSDEAFYSRPQKMPLQKGDRVRFRKSEDQAWRDGYMVRYTQPEQSVFVSPVAPDDPHYSEKADDLVLISLFQGLLQRNEEI